MHSDRHPGGAYEVVDGVTKVIHPDKCNTPDDVREVEHGDKSRNNIGVRRAPSSFS